MSEEKKETDEEVWSAPDTVWVAPTACVIDKVKLGNHVTIFPGAIIRGDTEQITIGDHSNIQDNAVLHADPGKPLVLGKHVSIGHGAVLHGCKVEDSCVIGMHSTVMNGAVIGEGSVVGTGCVVTESTVIPPNSIVVGIPAKILKSDQKQLFLKNTELAMRYSALGERYRKGKVPWRYGGALSSSSTVPNTNATDNTAGNQAGREEVPPISPITATFDGPTLASPFPSITSTKITPSGVAFKEARSSHMPLPPRDRILSANPTINPRPGSILKNAEFYKRFGKSGIAAGVAVGAGAVVAVASVILSKPS